MKVLLVEDSPLDRKLIAEHLRHGGCTLVEASSVTEAVETLRAHPDADLAILDVLLSNGTAMDLLVELEKMRNDVPVILTSADPTYRSLVPNRPLTYWVEKPIRFREFLSVVERAVDAGKSLETVRRSVDHLAAFLARWGV